jgi:hypothetical protein
MTMMYRKKFSLTILAWTSLMVLNSAHADMLSANSSQRFLPRTPIPSTVHQSFQLCGSTQATVALRVADCVAKNGANATWIGSQQGEPTSGTWNLVSVATPTNGNGNCGSGIPYTGAPGNACYYKEVWQDQQTQLLWSSKVSTAENWCVAAGVIEPKDPACINPLYQPNASANIARSYCAESGGTNFTPVPANPSNWNVTEDWQKNTYSSAKGQIGGNSSPGVTWKLPATNDYDLAMKHGLLSVMPDMGTYGNNQNEWTSSYFSMVDSGAWFIGDNGRSFNGGQNNQANMYAVRCIGSINTTPPPVCTHANPKFSITPTDAQWVTAGDSASFALSVTNKDSAACAPSVYALNNIVNPKISSELSTPNLTLNPGSTDTVTLTLKSSTDSVSGQYPVNITATNNAYPVYQSYVTATLGVNAACTRAAPVLMFTPDSQQGNAGDKKTYTLLLQNRDSNGCSTANFNIYANIVGNTGSTGFIANIEPNHPLLSPGQTVTASISVQIPATVLTGNYTVWVSGQNAVSQLSSLTSGNLSVNGETTPACIHNYPTISLTPASAAITPAGQITYKITFANNDSAACAPATMQLYTNILNSSGTGVGFSASFQPRVITLGGGQTASSLLQVSAPTNLIKGNYTTWVSIQNLTTNFNALTSGTLTY